MAYKKQYQTYKLFEPGQLTVKALEEFREGYIDEGAYFIKPKGFTDYYDGIRPDEIYELKIVDLLGSKPHRYYLHIRTKMGSMAILYDGRHPDAFDAQEELLKLKEMFAYLKKWVASGKDITKAKNPHKDRAHLKKDYAQLLSIVETWGPHLFLQWSVEVLGKALDQSDERLEKGLDVEAETQRHDELKKFYSLYDDLFRSLVEYNYKRKYTGMSMGE